MSLRDEKAASMLLHVAAAFIAREAGRGTLITPTRADISPDRKNAKVYVSVFPYEETPHALEFLRRNREEFRMHMKKEARFSVLPRVIFEADEGEHARQHLDDLSRELEGS